MCNGVLAAVLAAGGLAAGCHVLTGVDDLAVGEAAGGGGAEGTGADATGGTATGTGGGATGGTGGVECVTPDDCGPKRDCEIRSCDAGYCSIEDRPEGFPCTDMGANVCNGQGRCVECNVSPDCTTASFICIDEGCYPASCNNGQQGQLETDVDCGGATCPPCEDGLACLVYTDCESAFCSDLGSGGTGGIPSSLCSPCQSNADCPLTPQMTCTNNRCR